ncbi:hypothetical protein PSP6_80276 [Paraburkholderia tropica]|nr:hypothetical protein PSP6_80276 [Paraburkholderia tropica]
MVAASPCAAIKLMLRPTPTLTLKRTGRANRRATTRGTDAARDLPEYRFMYFLLMVPPLNESRNDCVDTHRTVFA